MQLLTTTVITDGLIDTITDITDIHTIMAMDIMDYGMAREMPKNLEMLEDTGEVRILHPHHNITADQNMICRDNEEVRMNQVPHLDRMPLLKPTLMPQPGITHITQAIMDITDTASAILDIMGTDIPIMEDITGDEDKNFEFFFLLQNTTNSSTIWTSWN